MAKNQRDLVNILKHSENDFQKDNQNSKVVIK